MKEWSIMITFPVVETFSLLMPEEMYAKKLGEHAVDIRAAEVNQFAFVQWYDCALISPRRVVHA